MFKTVMYEQIFIHNLKTYPLIPKPHRQFYIDEQKIGFKENCLWLRLVILIFIMRNKLISVF